MSGVLNYNVDSVVPGGVYITVTSVNTGYQTGDTIDITINDNGPVNATGNWTGQMVTTAKFGNLGVSSFYTWFELIEYSPPEPSIVIGNDTTLEMLDITTGGPSNVTYYNGEGLFPWPGAGGGGGGGGGVPCFTASSKLLTPSGYKSAEDIKTGDLLMTADGRQVPVKAVSYTVEVADKESAPFFIPKNSISMGCPNADLRLSPWHAFQMKKGLWMKPMSAFELGMPVKQYDNGKPVTYYHFEAPNYFKDNFVCEGTVVESFGGLQTKDMKGRMYTYNSSLKGYTRVAAKPVSKTIMM